jgi:hypothetical protein
MPNSYKILGQISTTANTLSNVYVVPSSTAAVVNSITITNLSASNVSYSIAAIPSGQVISASTLPRYFIIRGATIPASDEAILDFVMTLPAGTVLAANSSTSSLSISAFGAEVS